jgi:hypothetical protein
MDGLKSTTREEHQRLIIDLLSNGSDEKVVSLLIDLKESKSVFMLETLLELSTTNRSDVLKRAIIEFVSNVKNIEAVPIMVNFLTKSFPAKKVIDVVTMCWQSRLDFSKDLHIFFEILQKGNYQTAFEAFTVIENSLDCLNIDEISECIVNVKKGIISADRDKQLLLLEMVSLLEKAKREAS